MSHHQKETGHPRQEPARHITALRGGRYHGNHHSRYSLGRCACVCGCLGWCLTCQAWSALFDRLARRQAAWGRAA